MERKGFTLAEVLITLAIIGVVAALTIPSVIVNAREQGNITAYKKAISVLNSAVSLNSAIDDVSPTNTTAAAGLLAQLSSKMNVISSSSTGAQIALPAGTAVTAGIYFTTADGMQFIFQSGQASGTNGTALQLTNPSDTCMNAGVKTSAASAACTGTGVSWVQSGATYTPAAKSFGCTDAEPCVIIVDVNGASGPNNMSSDLNNASGTISDRFPIVITSDGVQPGGAQAQAVMSK